VPILASHKAHLQSLGLPSDADTIRRARHFVLRAGLTLAEFADLANLNPSSLRVYLSGHYDAHQGAESNTLAVRAALKQLMDRYEIEHIEPLQGTHYPTAEYEAVRKSMWTALRQGTSALVDGPPGTKKSYTFHQVIDEINKSREGHAFYVYVEINQSPQSFLIEACTVAGIPNRGTIGQMMRKLRFFLSGQRTLLVVDEAQHLGVAGMEVLRELLDTPPYFGVVLGGSHDLSVRLRDWRMEQWRSRLRRTHLLMGLTESEAAEILTGELGPMHPQDIADTIADATVEAVRDRKTFKYISARNLFFAIEDAKLALAESAVNSKPEPEEQEAIA